MFDLTIEEGIAIVVIFTFLSLIAAAIMPLLWLRIKKHKHVKLRPVSASDFLLLIAGSLCFIIGIILLRYSDTFFLYCISFTSFGLGAISSLIFFENVTEIIDDQSQIS